LKVIVFGTLKSYKNRNCCHCRRSGKIMENYLDRTENTISLRQKTEKLFKNKNCQKKGETESSAITDQWQTTFDSINDAIWLLDKEHNILRSNKKADTLFGSGNIGKKCYNIIHGKDCPIKGCPVQLAFKQKCHKTLEFQIGDKWYDISADPILDANGNVTSAVHIVRDITTQKKTEDDLRESEKTLNTIIEHIPFAVFVHNLDGEFIKVNSFASKYTGYSKAELLKMDVADIDKESLSRNDREKIWVQLNQSGEKQIISNHYKKDGSTYPVEVTLTSITLQNKPVFLSIAQDISERQKAEQALQESEYLHKKTQKIAKMGGWSYIVENQQMTFTDTIYEIYGKKLLTAEEGIQFYHPDDQAKVWKSFSDAISKQKPYDLEVRFINAQGKNLFVRTIGQPIIKNGKVVKIYGDLLDITERKTAELALKDSEEKFRTVADHAYDWEYWIDINGNCIYSSPSCERITGYKSDDFLNNKEFLREIVHPDDLNIVRNHHHNIDENANVSQTEFRIITKQNKIRWIGHVCKNVIATNGKPLGVRGSNRDITERKKIELALKDSEAKYRTIIEHSGNAIAIRQNGKFEFANKAFSKLLDYSRIELFEIKNSLIFDWDILKDMEKRLSKNDLNENSSMKFETMMTKKDKTKIDVEIFEKIISYKEEKAQLIIVRDITKQKAIMKELQRGAEQAKGLNKFIPICASCSLIHDEEKENKPWVKPADYITERLPDILFSHSLCPDCLKKWEAELDSDDK
jgi:PAS domain S-box-containing protein